MGRRRWWEWVLIALLWAAILFFTAKCMRSGKWPATDYWSGDQSEYYFNE